MSGVVTRRSMATGVRPIAVSTPNPGTIGAVAFSGDNDLVGCKSMSAQPAVEPDRSATFSRRRTSRPTEDRRRIEHKSDASAVLRWNPLTSCGVCININHKSSKSRIPQKDHQRKPILG
jgi:hypothetical protein